MNLSTSASWPEFVVRRYRAKQKTTLVRGHVVWTKRPLTPYSLHGAAGDGDDRKWGRYGNRPAGSGAVLLWQRLLITLATMLLTSFVAGLLWQELFSSYIPSYLSGIIGGVTAVPMWEFLKRIKIK